MLKRVITTAVVLATASLASPAFRPPSEWRHIQAGMSAAKVREFVPGFHGSSFGNLTGDFYHKDAALFRWRLAVFSHGDRVEAVERELWIRWPGPRRLRTIITK
jgi:hypothetical protein